MKIWYWNQLLIAIDRMINNVDRIANDIIIARFVINVDKQETINFAVLYRIKYLFSYLFVLEICER